MPTPEDPFDELRPDGDRPPHPHAEPERTRADDVDFSRSGLEDAPPLVNKRWFVLGGGLVAAIAAVAIVAGTGLVSSEDLGLIPPDPTPTPDALDDEGIDRSDGDGISKLTQATGTCMGGLRDNREANRELGRIPLSTSEDAVAYGHETDDYAAAVVSDGVSSEMCATTGVGMFSSSYADAAFSAPLEQDMRHTDLDGVHYVELLGGRVTDDVLDVQIQSDGESVGQAHLAAGYFSAFVTTPPGGELSYLVTMEDGRKETVVDDDPFYRHPLEREESAYEQIRESTKGCFDDVGITLPESMSGDDEGQSDTVEYRLLSAHLQSSYIAAIATNGTDVTGCVNALDDRTWRTTAPLELPRQALIAPMEPSPGPTRSGPYPVVGRSSPEVVSVEVIRSDGSRRETYVKEGFYSVMMSADKATDMTYVVTTKDGVITTVGID